MKDSNKITRTFSYTVGFAKVYDEKVDGLVEKEFKINFSILNDSDEKILRKAEKELKQRVVGLKNVHRVDELYAMPVKEFLKYATLVKTSDENGEIIIDDNNENVTE